MAMSDFLGDEGRKAVDSCVKVAIFKQPRIVTRKEALKRLWDCFAGRLPNVKLGKDLDPVILPERDHEGKEKKYYDINDIHDALQKLDKMEFVQKYREDGQRSEEVETRRNDVLMEYQKFLNGETDVTSYSVDVAQRRVRDCYAGNFPGDVQIPINLNNDSAETKPFTIIDIRDALVSSDKLGVVKYPKEVDGSYARTLKEFIEKQRNSIETEYRAAIDEGKLVEGQLVNPSYGKQRYSRDEAERRVRDCFVGSFKGDADILPIKNQPRKDTYNISDIKDALDYYDKKKLVDKYPEVQIDANERSKKIISDLLKSIITEVDKCRKAIEQEYKEATTDRVEINHGSGFIIQNHFIVTNSHVVSQSDGDVYIYNQAIDPKLPCEIIHWETLQGIDLALLYCKDLNIGDIKPLQLSDQNPLPGTPIFSFGYPFFHTGKRALLVTGYVSCTDEAFGLCQEGASPWVIINCPVNQGNSGGPLLHCVNNEVKVAGVIVQKHIKDILEPSEGTAIDKIKKSLQTKCITYAPLGAQRTKRDVKKNGESHDPCQTSLNLLTLKLYDALKTHCQFVSGKAIPQVALYEFLKKAATNYKGDNEEELQTFA